MKKVIVLAFQFPPYNEVGSYRWHNLSLALAAKGHEVHVLTVDWGADKNFYRDNFSQITVHVLNSGSPHKLRKRKIKNPYFNFIKNLPFRLLIDNFFFHDYAQRWERAVREKLQYLINDRESVVIATGAPFHVNYIAAQLKEHFSSLKVIQDIRDIWSKNPYLKISEKQLNNIKSWEHYALSKADACVFISEGLKRSFAGEIFMKNAVVISNGFGKELSMKMGSVNSARNDSSKISLVHIGSITNGREVPLFQLLEFIASKEELQNSIVIQLIGSIPLPTLVKLKSKYLFLINKNVLLIEGVIPREKALAYIKGASFALLLNSPDLLYALSTKIYEHMMLNIPTLSLNYGGDIEDFLKNNHIGHSLNLSEKGWGKKLEDILLGLSKTYFSFGSVNEFSYDELAERYSNLVESL